MAKKEKVERDPRGPFKQTRLKIRALKKKNACLGGFATDGGWNVPVGTLYNDAEMKPAENSTRYTEDAQAIFDFYYDEYYDQLINTYEMPIL